MFLHIIAFVVGFGVVSQGQILQETYGEKVIGGVPINITKAPYLVQISDSGVPICSGSVISNEYILTAAQCTFGRKPAQLSIRSGTSILNKGGVVTNVSEIFQNPSYSERLFDYDVAVLKLAKPITFNEQTQPINLTNSEPQTYERAFLAGWGKLKEGAAWYPAQLQAVTLTVSDRIGCNKIYAGRVTNNMFCIVGYGKGHCEGDAGGPIIVNGSQVGIISWGEGCGQLGYPSVSSNVAILREFIDSKMKGNASWAIASKLNLSLSVLVFFFSFK